jgi:hypothetical protein
LILAGLDGIAALNTFVLTIGTHNAAESSFPKHLAHLLGNSPLAVLEMVHRWSTIDLAHRRLE